MAPGNKGNVDGAEREKPDLMSAFLMVIIFTVYPVYITAKSQSGYWELLILPTTTGLKFDLNVFVLYVAWLIFQSLLYVLPIGGKLAYGQQLRDGHRLQYRLNGFFALVVNILIFTVIGMSGVRMSVIADNIYEVVTIAVVLQFIISVLLLFAIVPRYSYEINPMANRGNIIGDWLLGKSLNPRVGVLDIKFVFFRSSVIALVLYNFSILAKTFESNHGSNITLLVAIGMQLFYIADTLWFESSFLFLKETVYEGFGCVNLLQCVSVPIGFTVVISYIARMNWTLQWYWLLIIVTIYFMGYWIYRASNEEKKLYRLNPRDEMFKDYEVITTETGRNLLVSGWWGMCRHPNYLGDIICCFVMCFPAGFHHVLPYLNPTLTALFLLDRESTDGIECKRKYGEAWDRYCHRVKYRFIPYVY